MANQRITKEMARKAASEMKRDKFEPKIKKAQDTLIAYIDELIEKWVPAEVREAFANHQKWYSSTRSVMFNADGGGSGSYTEINIGNTPYPPLRCITIDPKEYVKLTKLQRDKRDLESKASYFYNDCVTVLTDLAYENRVKEQFPQALPYLNFSGSTVVAPSVQKLIDILNEA